MEDIDTVYSHPQGFAQCRPFSMNIGDWKIETLFFHIPKRGTCFKGRKEKSSRRSKPDAAELYGLSVLKENVFF